MSTHNDPTQQTPAETESWQRVENEVRGTNELKGYNTDDTPTPLTDAAVKAHRYLNSPSLPEGCLSKDIADDMRTLERANAALRASAEADFEVFHQLRMKLTAACGDPYKLHDEALDAIVAERDALRAEVAALKACPDHPYVKQLQAEVERLKAEVSKHSRELVRHHELAMQGARTWLHAQHGELISEVERLRKNAGNVSAELKEDKT
jgi:hypothetical protein